MDHLLSMEYIEKQPYSRTSGLGVSK